MSENILVVEYEPRYTDRVRQALQGQPFMPMFARDGEEAIRALDGEQPRLIVLSSVVPKVSTTELIRTIRGRNSLQQTPILLTVSGYNGKSPKADAQRVGASDILPKPYSETEFLGKIQQMLGVRSDAPAATQQLTSNEIFGELLEDDKPARKADRGTGDVDKMLADTLAGVMPSRRKEPTQAGNVPVPPPPSAQAGRAKTGPGSAELDKILHDTLSGLEKKKTVTGAPVPQPPQAAAPAPASAPAAAPVPAAPQQPPEASRFATDRLSAYVPDRVPVSQPVFPQPVAQPKLEEDDARDGVRFGQYVLLEKIATGGMAEVWKARMRGVEGFQKIVAIKKILPHLSDNQDFIEMFVDEAKLAAQLNHNNIIHIYDLGKIQSSYYIAMEYIDGFDLKTILRLGQEHDNPMNVELALFVGSKVASALDYAHRKKDFEEKEMGLVHRDVSPQNVLISQEGDIKLCDFGIAKAASKASHTQAGALKGKLQYMSPEQAWGKHIDRRSDVFALAAVLFELLTSKKLFSGDNEISILEQVREARVQPPSLYNDEVTPEIDRIVLKALQKEPADRYQTAGEMARDLDAVLYSFRPTPTSADLAIYMHRLSSPETVVEAEPEPERPAAAAALPQPPVISPVKLPAPPVINTSAAPAAAVVTPVAAPIPAAAPAAAAPTYGDIPEPVKRKSSAGLIIAAVVALAVIGGAAFFFLRQPAAAPAATAAKSSVAPAPPTQTAPLTAASTTTDLTSTAATGTLAATATTASIDPSLVDAEVQKRIAAERTRLEALARAQQQTQTTAPLRPVPAPVQQAAQQQPAPAPAPQETRPAPAPVVQETAAPAPQVAETRPAAPAPVVQRAKEGDLVPPGTEGLTAPRMTRRGTVQYPPLARTQKIEGTVITSVLVSERGDVLEVRILRGVNRPGGLNEAAIQAMRRSSFAAGMKDGVRVKAWLTVPVEFKL